MGMIKAKTPGPKPGVISPPKEWRLWRIASPALNIARPVHSFNQVPGWPMPRHSCDKLEAAVYPFGFLAQSIFHRLKED
jgi:hypothetical protein